MPQNDAENHTAASEDPRPYTYERGEHRSGPLTIAAILVAVEGIVALGYGVTWGYLSLAGNPLDETASLMGAVFVTLGSLLLLRMAWGLWNVDVWPRVPTIVIQLILVPVGWSLAFTLGNVVVGVPVLAGAIALICLLFSTSVREGYGRDV